MHDKGEARTAPSHRVLEHLQVAIGVAECRNRKAADVFMDTHGFARSVVDKVDFRQAQKHRLSITQFELDLAAAANNVLRWDAINSLRPRPHEIDAPARDNERFEAVRAEVGD